MAKSFVYILIGSLVFIMFFTPARNYMNNLFRHDKQEELEERLIGRISVYNPRLEEIQKILKESGFDPGPVDGVMGGQTRVAIRLFQQEEGLKPTGRIDPVTQAAFGRERKTGKPIFLSAAEPDAWESSFLNKDTLEEIDKENLADKVKPHDEIATPSFKSTDRAKQIQAALKNAGFYKGGIDGKIGPRSKAAIKAFQRAKKLNPDGVAGAKTWEELKRYLVN